MNKVDQFIESLLSETTDKPARTAAEARQLEQELKQLVTRNTVRRRLIQNIRTESDDSGVWFDVTIDGLARTYVIYRNRETGKYVPYEVVHSGEIDQLFQRDLDSLSQALTGVIQNARQLNLDY